MKAYTIRTELMCVPLPKLLKNRCRLHPKLTAQSQKSIAGRLTGCMQTAIIYTKSLSLKVRNWVNQWEFINCMAPQYNYYKVHCMFSDLQLATCTVSTSYYNFPSDSMRSPAVGKGQCHNPCKQFLWGLFPQTQYKFISGQAMQARYSTQNKGGMTKGCTRSWQACTAAASNCVTSLWWGCIPTNIHQTMFPCRNTTPSITRTCIMQANVASWKLIVMLCSHLTGSPTIVYLNVALEIGVKVEESEAMNAHCSWNCHHHHQFYLP
jgi:hypothetical protein